MSEDKRYVRLKPMDVDAEVELALLAADFFSPRACAGRGSGGTIRPASGSEFMESLEKGAVGTNPDRYVYQIRSLLERMSANGILTEMGASGNYVLMPKSYYCFYEMSNNRAAGILWPAKTLGGRLVHRTVSPAVVHLVGEDDDGEASGLIFALHHVLTCKHVVSGMPLAPTQRLQDTVVTVEDVYRHPKVDVAVVRVKETLEPVPGLLFLTPEVSQKVYRFGYSRVPCSIPMEGGESPMVMQSGEVTNQSLTVFGNQELFLYSAVARPGDSGGPIVSEDGYVVGMTTELSDGRIERGKREEVFSPHYAGIPADVIARAVDDLDLGVRIPYETFDECWKGPSGKDQTRAPGRRRNTSGCAALGGAQKLDQAAGSAS